MQATYEFPTHRVANAIKLVADGIPLWAETKAEEVNFNHRDSDISPEIVRELQRDVALYVVKQLANVIEQHNHDRAFYMEFLEACGLKEEYFGETKKNTSFEDKMARDY